MNPNHKKRDDRWSLYGLASRSKPRGDSECLGRALAELGPFSSEHNEASKERCICAKCSEDAVILAAAGFNAFENVIDGAPRTKVVVKELRDVEQALRDAAAKLVGLSNHSRKTLRNWDRADFDNIAPERYQDVVVEQTPEPDTHVRKGSTGAFVERLLALADHAEFCARTVEQISQGKPGSKGGRTNLMRGQLGPTAARLVVQCWIIFNKGRQVKATASENGSFVRFLNAVHEYATGELEESSTLINWAKKLAKPLRKYDESVAAVNDFAERFLAGNLFSDNGEKLTVEQLIFARSELQSHVADAHAAIVRIIGGARE